MARELRSVASNAQADIEDHTTFGDVLHALCADKKLNQYELSVKTGYSQPAISRIVKGERSCTPKLAGRLAEVLGGTEDLWLEVYEETHAGSNLPIAHYRQKLVGPVEAYKLPGTRIRRLLRDDILDIFDPAKRGIMKFNGEEEECEIADFDAARVQITSYDTKLGSSSHFETEEISEALNGVSIAPKELIKLRTLECFALPSWLEADLHPASNLGRRGLFVANGPIIDPGFNGYLTVSVFNAGHRDVFIGPDDPFLTVRFWMQDV